MAISFKNTDLQHCLQREAIKSNNNLFGSDVTDMLPETLSRA